MNRVTSSARRARTIAVVVLATTALSALGLAAAAPATASTVASATAQGAWPVPSPLLPGKCEHLPFERPFCF